MTEWSPGPDGSGRQRHGSIRLVTSGTLDNLPSVLDIIRVVGARLPVMRTQTTEERLAKKTRRPSRA